MTVPIRRRRGLARTAGRPGLIHHRRRRAHSSVTITFDKPVTDAQANELRAQYAPVTANASVNYGDWEILCWTSNGYQDSNGYFSVQYSCGTGLRTLPWGFQLSATLQATVVGNINEAGLSYWRNGSFAGQNAPHTVPANYQLHGTMATVYASNRIEFQDYISWRHNIGPGGTAVLTFAGRLYLKN